MNKKPTPDLNRTNARLSDVGRRRFEKDQFIFREHETGDLAFIIAEGQVEILKDYNGNLTSLRVLEKGAMFGEMALIDDEPRMASAKAINGPVELLEVSKANFKKKMNELDPFTRGLICILADTVRHMAKQQ